MDICSALTKTGMRCSRHASGGHALCGTHRSVIARFGERRFRMEQIDIKRKSDLNNLKIKYDADIVLANNDQERRQLQNQYAADRRAIKNAANQAQLELGEQDAGVIQDLTDVYNLAIARLTSINFIDRGDMRWHMLHVDMLIAQHRLNAALFRRDGREGAALIKENYIRALQNMTEEDHARNVHELMRKRDAYRRGLEEHENAVNRGAPDVAQYAMALEILRARFAAELDNPNPELGPIGDIRREAGGAAGGELARFTSDKQNVHTSVMVKQTQDIVNSILKIPVPEGYRWHKTVCSKTPGEIIMECGMSQRAAWQMMSQYAQDTSIYEMGEGIYGKVLDSAWQFIKTHPEKESLIAILRIEMNDNVGMCAQGNLTRVCNILAGYMDGVGSQESLSERLGRLLPPLRKIENRDERQKRITEILEENAVPAGERDAWLEAVMDDE